MTTEHLTGAQVLDELERLARVEHALIVEYLSVACAMGHDLDAADGGATTIQGRAAAGTASGLAVGDMFRFRRINTVLVAAGRTAELGRADSVPGASGDIPLAPPTAADLQHLLDRENAIAKAVDALYRRLGRGLTAATDLDSEVVDQVRALVEDGTTHAAAARQIRDALGEVTPDVYLRATRREAANSTEQRVLDLSDRIYQLTLALLRERFAPDSLMGQSLPVSAMMALDDANRLVVQRGLLPPFSL